MVIKDYLAIIGLGRLSPPRVFFQGMKGGYIFGKKEMLSGLPALDGEV
jgi:hypothetical protein